MNIFVSYVSEQRATANEVALALRGEGHDVFLDRTELPEGDAYNRTIREALLGCDLVVFLVSPEAVAAGRYTLTELKFAEDKWPSPVGRVLPVMVRPTDTASLPAYLRAVVLLRPSGNVAAEVVAAVERLSKPWWVRALRRCAAFLIVVAVLGAGVGAWRAYERGRGCGQARDLAQEAQLLQSAADYAAAWERFAAALASCPGDSQLAEGQERLALAWLDDIRVTAGQQTFTDIVTQVQPVLAQGAIAADDRRAANALAHLGWGDFLRSREGTGGLDPVRYYREAVARDPQNPFAHTMWGHHVMQSGGAVEEAKTHFTAALTSGTERPYIRRMQIAAFLWRNDADVESEVVRVANDMRIQGETLPPGTAHDSLTWRIWNVYYGQLVTGYDKERFLAALPPEEHLATFHWLYPEPIVPEDKRFLYLFMLAQLLEHAGQRADATATFQSVLDLLQGRGLDDTRAFRGAEEGLRRLTASDR